MKMNMTKKSKIAIGLVIALLMVTTVAAAWTTIISNTWTSHYITVSPLLLSLSSDLTEDKAIQPEVPMEYTMTLVNPNAAYSYTGVHVIVEIRDVSDNKILVSDVTVAYWDPTSSPAKWITKIFTQGDASYIYYDWSGGTPFVMPPVSITILFSVTYHTPGIYQGTAYAVQ